MFCHLLNYTFDKPVNNVNFEEKVDKTGVLEINYQASVNHWQILSLKDVSSSLGHE